MNIIFAILYFLHHRVYVVYFSTIEWLMSLFQMCKKKKSHYITIYMNEKVQEDV